MKQVIQAVNTNGDDEDDDDSNLLCSLQLVLGHRAPITTSSKHLNGVLIVVPYLYHCLYKTIILYLDVWYYICYGSFCVWCFS